MSIGEDIMEQDRVEFQFNYFPTRDLITYLKYALLGAKRYLLKEKDENIPKALKKIQRCFKICFFFNCVFFKNIFFFTELF